MSIEAMKQALEALDAYSWEQVDAARAALRTAIERNEKQEPVAWAEEIITDLHALYDSEMITENDSGDALIRLDAAVCAVEEAEQRHTTPPAAQGQPLIDSVRQMRDVQGMDGTWNYDPYMQGLYNGLEFAVSLLEQREPQFKDAPEKWLSDLPKPRIFSATEAAHGIGEKK